MIRPDLKLFLYASLSSFQEMFSLYQIATTQY